MLTKIHENLWINLDEIQTFSINREDGVGYFKMKNEDAHLFVTAKEVPAVVKVLTDYFEPHIKTTALIGYKWFVPGEL